MNLTKNPVSLMPDFLVFIMYSLTFKTPVGYLELESNDTFLKMVLFVDSAKNSSDIVPEVLLNAKIQLNEYFEGARKEFNIPLAPEGTDFQIKVWHEVSKVQFGKTSSYLDIAKATGSSKNTRAVGLANGINPIPIIIPCHRIIGSNGKLTGYSGGLNIKRWLLNHELENTPNTNLLF